MHAEIKLKKKRYKYYFLFFITFKITAKYKMWKIHEKIVINDVKLFFFLDL